MCYQKVNQNWRKSRLRPSLGASKFNQPHIMIWTLRPPANSNLHSTSLQPPPMGTGAAKCISQNLNFIAELESGSDIMFLLVLSESFWPLEPFLKMYHSLKSLENQFWHSPLHWGLFHHSHLLQVNISDPGVPTMEWRSFRGNWISRWKDFALLLSWSFLFVCFFKHIDKPYFSFVEILNGVYCVCTKGEERMCQVHGHRTF